MRTRISIIFVVIGIVVASLGIENNDQGLTLIGLAVVIVSFLSIIHKHRNGIRLS